MCNFHSSVVLRAGCPLDPNSASLLCQFSHGHGRSRFEGMVGGRCIYATLVMSPEINQCWITAFPASSPEKFWHHHGMTRPQQWSNPASSPETLGFRRTWKRCRRRTPRFHMRSSPSFIDLPHPVQGAKWPQHEPGFIFWRQLFIRMKDSGLKNVLQEMLSIWGQVRYDLMK